MQKCPLNFTITVLWWFHLLIGEQNLCPPFTFLNCDFTFLSVCTFYISIHCCQSHILFFAGTRLLVNAQMLWRVLTNRWHCWMCLYIHIKHEILSMVILVLQNFRNWEVLQWNQCIANDVMPIFDRSKTIVVLVHPSFQTENT